MTGPLGALVTILWLLAPPGSAPPTSFAQVTTPTPVQGLSEVTAIAGAAGHGLALRRDGAVWTWGWNGYGQLGNGTTIESNQRVPRGWDEYPDAPFCGHDHARTAETAEYQWLVSPKIGEP